MRRSTVCAADECDALGDQFLAASEGREFASDGDVASLAIDSCAAYVDALRWSPVVVE